MSTRWSGWLAAAAALVLVCACSSRDNGGVVGGTAAGAGAVAPAGQLHRLLPAPVAAAGVLRVAGDISRAPLLFYGTGTTQPEGFEWDLLQDVGRQLGVAVTVVNVPLARLVPTLQAHQADLIASGFVDLKVIEQQGIDLVDYLDGRTAVLAREGNPTHVGGVGDLCGRTVGVQFATAQELVAGQLDAACRSGRHPGITIRLAPDHAALLALLVGGQVQADVDDAVVASYAAETSTGASTVAVVGQPVGPQPYGIGVVHGDPQLLAAVQAALRAVITDGEYDSALSRWGGEAEALRTAGVNGGT